MAKPQPQLAALAAVFGADPRNAIHSARQAGFTGIQFDAHSQQLDVTELSASGRRELRAILRSSDLALCSLRISLGNKGLVGDADVDAALARLDAVLAAAVGLGAPAVCVDIGPLPEAKNPEPDSAATVDRALGELGAVADRYSVAVAFRSELAGFAQIERALRAADCAWFGIDLDPVAVLRDEWSMDEVFSRLGRMIRHVRGRDAILGVGHRTSAAPILRGSTRWDQLLARLDESDYRGWISVDSLELPNPGAAAVAAAAALGSLLGRPPSP